MNKGTALVTGASSGIGMAYAHELAKRGYNLIITARRVELLVDLADELKARYEVKVETVTADLSAAGGIKTVEQHILGCNDLSFLVNNAGFGTSGDFHEVDIEKSEAMINVHVIAVVRLTHAALQGMIERGHGAIVNVSSFATKIPGIGRSIYGGTKMFLDYFSESLFREVQSKGIQIQDLVPGFTLTGFHDTEELSDFDRNRVPKMMWLKPEQVVRESLEGLQRGKPVVIPGRQYRFMSAISVLARRIARSKLGRFKPKQEL